MKTTIQTTTRDQVKDLDTNSNPKAGGWTNHNETVVRDLDADADPKGGLRVMNHNETIIRDLDAEANPKAGGIIVDQRSSQSQPLPATAANVRTAMPAASPDDPLHSNHNETLVRDAA